jgi:hypothetical protein
MSDRLRSGLIPDDGACQGQDASFRDRALAAEDQLERIRRACADARLSHAPLGGYINRIQDIADEGRM